jgi:hypothetical protein
MCVTDLELDLDLDWDHEITEDEQAPSPGQPGPSPGQPGPDPKPAGGQAPGVAWGRAAPHTAAG